MLNNGPDYKNDDADPAPIIHRLEYKSSLPIPIIKPKEDYEIYEPFLSDEAEEEEDDDLIKLEARTAAEKIQQPTAALIFSAVLKNSAETILENAHVGSPFKKNMVHIIK